MKKPFRLLRGLCASLAASCSVHASVSELGKMPDVAQTQFQHPGYLQTAAVDLLASSPAGTIAEAKIVRITPGGKVLLSTGDAWNSRGAPASVLLGYVWTQGTLAQVRSPAWPWVYDHPVLWNPGVPDGDSQHGDGGDLSFALTDMNDQGDIVGICYAEHWGTTPLRLEYGESVGVLWPAGSGATPQALNPGIASAADRYQRYVDWVDIRMAVSDLRIDDAGNCYGVANVGCDDDWHEAWFDYLDDVVKWTDPAQPPANLTGNAALFESGSVSLSASSEISALSANGHLLVSTTRDAPASYHLLPPGGASETALFPALGATPSLVTDSGLVVGFGSRFPWIWNDGPWPSILSGYFPASSAEGDVLHPTDSKIWLRRPSPQGDYYVPATANVALPYVHSGNARRISGGLFVGGTLQRPLLRVPARLCVDQDHDGVIRPQTNIIGAVDLPPDERLYVKINDDDDVDATDTVSLAQTAGVDAQNNRVDGADDLADFTPVFLDIKRLLEVLPPGPSLRYKLKQADGAMNLLFTSLTAETAFDYLDDDATTGYGPNAAQAAAVATTQQITAGGIELSDEFLTRILDQGQGVILVEMRGLSDSPLRLVAENAAGVEVAELSQSFASFRFRADAGKVHLGFDPPNKAEGDAPDEYWASVVQGKSNTILNLDMLPTAAGGLEWRVAPSDTARVGVTMSAFTGTTAKLTLTGKNTGANLPETATIQLVPKGGAGSSYLTLNVMILPQREVKLAIYTIEDPDSPLTQFASAPAVAVPSDDEILSVCNDSFKQAGVRFVLHPQRGDRARPFRYDTWGLAEFLGVYRFDGLLPVRSPDGVLTENEKSGLVGTQANAPAPALGSLLPAAIAASDTIPILLFKDSGLPYDANNLSGPKRRGLSGNGRVFLFLRNLEPHAAVAAAHEVGHILDAHDSDDGHDNPTVTPPFPSAVMNEFPYGVSPAPPTDTRYPANPRPNVALMQGGWPTGEGLPWPYGRWMRHEDWDDANSTAESFAP